MKRTVRADYSFKPTPLGDDSGIRLLSTTSKMDKSKYDMFKALDPFFNIVMKGLDGLVDGDHFWDAVADEAVFEFRYRLPGWPERLESRDAYMTAIEVTAWICIALMGW